MERINARLNILGKEKIYVIEYPFGIYKGHKPNNIFGRSGNDNEQMIKDYDYEDLDIHQIELVKDFLRELKTDQQKKNRKTTLNRNTSKLRKIVFSNMGQYQVSDKFMTLTFRIKPKTMEIADNEFKKFMKRLRRKYGKQIQYIAIRELQKENNRNAIHYHIFVFNMQFVKQSELLQIWCTGNEYMDIQKPSGVHIQAIRNGLTQVINYLTGYAVKDLLDENDDWLAGKKMLLMSRDLKQPKIFDYSNFNDIPFDMTKIKKGYSFLDTKVTYLEL